MNTQNDTSLDIELEDLSEKIRQYISGESRALEGLMAEWNYKHQPEEAYINARNIALEIKQKYPGLPKLPQPHESKPIISLQGLLEWCIDNKSKQQPTDANGNRGRKRMVHIPPKFTDKNGKIFEGNEAWEKMWEKFLEFGRFTVPEKPFAGKTIKITNNNYNPGEGYRELLTEKERELFMKAIPELSDAGLEAVLRRVYNMGDERIKNLTWKEIFAFCKDYINSQNHEKKGALQPEQTKPAETGRVTTPAKVIHIENIENFKGILGDVQAKSVQTGNHASIHKHTGTEEKKKGILRRIPYWIYILVAFLAALLTSLHHLGWLEPIKAFVTKILWPK